LSSFYRSDRLTRQAAHELICYQLPDADDSVRQQIVNRLVGGYDAHDHIITRMEAQALGLQVRFTSSEEEALLWDLSKARLRQFLKLPGQPDEEGIVGLIMSSNFCARQVQRCFDAPGSQRIGARQEEENGTLLQKIPQILWEIDGE
jgi:hypothetical protein